ncbi:hypothetical protein CU044_2571 [Streptomyces sp. L-9-10]|uniref:hypothetical protein n=1 Tax=Streptomyces sp. L-9-10 TaxID=1478131 RepID=UPI00101C03A5|nr:hypothetical protein [Streptomyces sp. L-9-10]RYJ28810.1 hypothetical protein CU044_2571 [Streptomyces sp. L-9-10]
MPAPRLIAAVYVQRPSTREELILLPGECPDPEVAALVTNPDAWEVPPKDCEAGPEPDAVGPAAGEGEQDPEQKEADGRSGARKPPRRARTPAPS